LHHRGQQVWVRNADDLLGLGIELVVPGGYAVPASYKVQRIDFMGRTTPLDEVRLAVVVTLVTGQQLVAWTPACHAGTIQRGGEAGRRLPTAMVDRPGRRWRGAGQRDFMVFPEEDGGLALSGAKEVSAIVFNPLRARGSAGV